MPDLEPVGWYDSAELVCLTEALKTAVHETAGGAVLEVGVYRGLSARALDRHRADRQLILCDDLSLPGADPTSWPPPSPHTIHLLSPLPAAFSTPLCFYHEDAGHGYEGVSRRLIQLAPLIVAGGIIALHDYHDFLNYPGVARAWEAVCGGSGDWAHFDHADSLQVYQRRRT